MIRISWAKSRHLIWRFLFYICSNMLLAWEFFKIIANQSLTFFYRCFSTTLLHLNVLFKVIWFLLQMSPMRVLLKIQKSDPPGLDKPAKWSRDFNDFLKRCLLKDPNQRARADELLKVEFHPLFNFCNILFLLSLKYLLKL